MDFQVYWKWSYLKVTYSFLVPRSNNFSALRATAQNWIISNSKHFEYTTTYSTSEINCFPKVKGAVQYEVTHIPRSVFVNEYLKTGLPSYSGLF